MDGLIFALIETILLVFLICLFTIPICLIIGKIVYGKSICGLANCVLIVKH